MKFSEKLQKLRKEKGYSQEQLADLLEVSRQSVSKWESGTTYPEMDKLIALCKIFNVTLDDLTNDDVTDTIIKEKNKGTFNSIMFAILDIINKSMEMFKNMSKKEVMKCITELLFLVFILLVFSLPFHYINDLARNIFINFENAYSVLYSIWYFFTNIIYLVLFISIFLYVYKSRYLDKYDFNKIKEEDLEEFEVHEISVGKKTEEGRNHNFVLFSILSSLFNFFVKFALLMILIPLICIFFAFIFILAVSVILMLKKIIYIGIIICLIGCVLLCSLVMEIVIKFIINAKLQFKKTFLIFILGITLCSVGGAIATFEIMDLKWIDDVPSTEKQVVKKMETEFKKDMMIDDYNYYVTYDVDESLTDKIIICNVYYEKYISTSIEINNNIVSVHTWNASNVVKNIYNLLLDNLRNDEVYNYSGLSKVGVTVITSSANIEILKNNRSKYYEEIEKQELENEYLMYNNRINGLLEENNNLSSELNKANSKILELEQKLKDINNVID